MAALGLSCSMWDLVPWSGIKPRPPALGVQSLSPWTTREVPFLADLLLPPFLLSLCLWGIISSPYAITVTALGSDRIWGDLMTISICQLCDPDHTTWPLWDPVPICKMDSTISDADSYWEVGKTTMHGEVLAKACTNQCHFLLGTYIGFLQLSICFLTRDMAGNKLYRQI